MYTNVDVRDTWQTVFFSPLKLWAVLLCCITFPTNSVFAATLFLSPSSGEYKVGSIVPVSIFVSSADTAMNAAAGEITFPKDKLEVTSLSTSGSIFSFWVENPTFTNTTGQVKFEGVVFDPGYKGSNGRILTINFRVKNVGSAPINFTSASVLANDGAATNILSRQTGAQLTLVKEVQNYERPVAPAPSASQTPKPVIVSPTHPDQAVWYSNPNPKFTWEVPSGVTAVRTLLDQSPSTSPTLAYDSPIKEKEVEGVKDGTWWMHVQFKDKTGWGPIGHYKVMIDTTAPEQLSLGEKERTNATMPNIEVSISVRDTTSDIRHVEMWVDGGESVKLLPDELDAYKTQALAPGNHTIFARAVDYAGNEKSAELDVSVLGLDPPLVSDYTREATKPDPVYVWGYTKYSEAVLYAVVTDGSGHERDYKIEDVRANGEFTWALSDLGSGDYGVELYVVAPDGAQSYRSNKVYVHINPERMYGMDSKMLLIGILLLLLLLLILLYFLVRIYRKFDTLGKKIGKEVGDVEHSLSHGRTILEKDIAEKVAAIKKKRTNHTLSDTEKDLVATIQTDLHDLEQYLRKEIDDIDDLLKK